MSRWIHLPVNPRKGDLVHENIKTLTDVSTSLLYCSMYHGLMEKCVWEQRTNACFRCIMVGFTNSHIPPDLQAAASVQTCCSLKCDSLSLLMISLYMLLDLYLNLVFRSFFMVFSCFVIYLMLIYFKNSTNQRSAYCMSN